MSYYKRVVYMDYYENGVKVSNAGFVKLMKMGGMEEKRTCLQIHIMNLPWQKALRGTVKLVLEERECLLGQIDCENGRGMLQVKHVEEALKGNGCNWEKWENSRICIEPEPGKTICCDLRREKEAVKDQVLTAYGPNDGREEVPEVESTAWQEPKEEGLERQEEENAWQNDEENEAEWPKSKETEDAQQRENMEEPKRNQNYPERGMRMKREKWSQLWEMLPHIHPFGDEREYLQMALQDLLILSGKHYRLVDNSFLLHGFYNYEHLILMRMCRRGTEKYYVGVPGNYYEREAQVAVWFGFESFEPKEEPAGEGDFGYYMISVEI